MLRFLLFSAIFIIASYCACAQKNFQAGSIILSTGEVKTGLIDYRKWEVNPRSINFKQGTDAPVESFTVNALQSFTVTGVETYKRFAFWKDALPVSLALAKPIGEEILVPDTAWLRVLVDDEKLSLFELIDEKPHYFLKQGNDTLQELIYKVLIDRKKEKFVNTYSSYRGQLKALVTNNRAVERQIDNAAYTADDLLPIIHNLNGTAAIKPSTKENAKTLRVYLTGGPVFNQFKTSLRSPSFQYPPQYNTLGMMKYKNAVDFAIGIGTDIYSLRGTQRFFLRAGLMYSQLSATGSYKGKDVYGDDRDDLFTLKMSRIITSVGLNFKAVNKNQFEILTGMNMQLNMASYPVNSMQTKAVLYEDLLPYQKIWPQVNIIGGLRILNKIELTVATQLLGEFSDTFGIHAEANSTALTISWYLK